MITEILDFHANLTKRIYPILIVLSIIIAGISLQQATKTKISTDFMGYYYPDEPGYQETHVVLSDFMGPVTVQILVEVDGVNQKDVYTEDVLDMTSKLVDTVGTIPGVFSVSSVLDLGDTRDEILRVPLDKRSKYVDGDQKYSLIEAEIDSTEMPKRIELIKTFQKTVEKIDKPKGTKVTVTGGLALEYAFFEAIKNGFAKSIIVTAFTITVVLFFIFRSLIRAAFIMIPILVAVLAAYGTMHTLNIPLNFITSTFGAITLGLGIDYSIHLVHRFQEELDKGKPNALNIAVSRIGRNTIFTAITTMAAFFGISIAGIRMLTEFGVMSFIGISFSALSVILFLPSYLLLETKLNRGTIDFSRITGALGIKDILPTLTSRLSDFSVKKPFAVLFFMGLALFPILYGMSQIVSTSDAKMFLPKDDPIVVANNIVEDKFEAPFTFSYSFVLIEADDVREPEIMKAMEKVHESSMSLPWVEEVSSILSMIGPVSDSENKRDIIEKINGVPPDNRRRFLTKDYTEAIIIIRAEGTQLEESNVKELYDIIDYVETPEDATFAQAGTGVLTSSMLRKMEEGQARMTVVSIILVLVILSFALKSPYRIPLALGPVLIAIVFATGTMGLLGIPSTPITIMLATVMLGLGIDYSIHFLSRYNEEKEKGLSTEEALHSTSLKVGESIALTTVTTIFGFLSLITMILVPVQDFGKISAIGLAISAIFVIMLISAGIVINERVIARLISLIPHVWRLK